MRAITDAASNTNREAIEITTVAGAAGYRIYMTQNEDPDQTWVYSAAKVKKLVWDDG